MLYDIVELPISKRPLIKIKLSPSRTVAGVLAHNSFMWCMRHTITNRRMIGSASIFFGVLFLFMNGVLILDYELTWFSQQPGGNLWWYMYVIFFFGWLILGCVKLSMPIKPVSEEEPSE